MRIEKDWAIRRKCIVRKYHDIKVLQGTELQSSEEKQQQHSLNDFLSFYLIIFYYYVTTKQETITTRISI